jgi:hypothetical protein
MIMCPHNACVVKTEKFAKGINTCPHTRPPNIISKIVSIPVANQNDKKG